MVQDGVIGQQRGAPLEIAGARVTVMGLGILGGGVGVARYFAERGAHVTVTDLRSEEELAGSIAELDGLDVTYHLGEHDLHDFSAAGADIVVRNPGVRRTSPFLARAREEGVSIEMEMSIFFRACPAPIVGVTGTKGKTSVSALIGEMVQRWIPESVVAGNMGVSALARLPEIEPETPVVIELSSWQLEALDDHVLAPHVAVLTNISEDHLDSYDGFLDYARTKGTIAHHQTADDIVVYNADQPLVREVIEPTAARRIPFGLHDAGEDGAWLSDNEFVWRQDGQETRWPHPNSLQLSGDHGAANALAAIAAAMSYGVPATAVGEGLQAFAGVENRMEPVAIVEGVSYINDTSATAPAAAIAALQVMTERAGADHRVHVIAGGADKATNLRPFTEEVARLAPHVVLLAGTATPRIESDFTELGVAYDGPVESMAAAVEVASTAAVPGDIVILSPACASFGMFRNEFDRGEQFRQAVQRLGGQR